MCSNGSSVTMAPPHRMDFLWHGNHRVGCRSNAIDAAVAATTHQGIAPILGAGTFTNHIISAIIAGAIKSQPAFLADLTRCALRERDLKSTSPVPGHSARTIDPTAIQAGSRPSAPLRMTNVSANQAGAQ